MPFAVSSTFLAPVAGIDGALQPFACFKVGHGAADLGLVLHGKIANLPCGQAAMLAQIGKRAPLRTGHAIDPAVEFREIKADALCSPVEPEGYETLEFEHPVLFPACHVCS